MVLLNKQNKKLFGLGLLAAIGLAALAVLFLAPVAAHAQDAAAQTSGALVQPGNLGLAQVGADAGLGKTPFAATVGKIIRVVLSLLGVLTISIIIYGGFRWMVSSGNEEALEKAKKTIVNGVIGLVIVLSAFAITEFVMRSLINATGAQLTTGTGNSNGDGGNIDLPGGGGGGSSSFFKVKSFSPPGDLQSPMNSKVSVVFNGPVDETSDAAKDKITVVGADGNPVVGTVLVDFDTVIFTPSADCVGAANEKCFTANQQYTITVKCGAGGFTSQVSKKSLSCSESKTSATFKVGSGIDTKGPTFSNIIPANNTSIGHVPSVSIEALIKDETAVAQGRILVDGVILETVSAASDKALQEMYVTSKKMSTVNDPPKKEHTVTFVATDVVGHTASTKIILSTVPDHCVNGLSTGIPEAGELGLDCSGANGDCKLCAGMTCQSDKDCKTGYFCDATKKVCSSSPVIQSVSPKDGAPDTFVTLSGAGFGTQTGQVIFMGDPKDPADDVVAGLACEKTWLENEVVVAVPTNATSGPILLRNAAGSSDDTTNDSGVLLSQFNVNKIQRPGICAIDPPSGLPGSTKIKITGNKALDNTGTFTRKLFFGGYLADKPQWGIPDQNSVSAYVPTIEAGPVSVAVVIGEIMSNPIKFTVSGISTEGKDPIITSVSPFDNQKNSGHGGNGQYVTIKGKNFGTTPNKVYFVELDKNGQPTSNQNSAEFSFPSECLSGFWGSDQVLAKVPKSLKKGIYNLVVYAYGNAKSSNAVKFEVTDEALHPELCAIVPNNGPANGGLTVNLYGENFGSEAGGVLFTPKVFGPLTSAKAWGQKNVSALVPAGVASGDVRLVSPKNIGNPTICEQSPNECSTPVYFQVQDCRVKSGICTSGTLCCADGSCLKNCSSSSPLQAVFAWCFSTGANSCGALVAPSVVETCAEVAKVGVTPTIPSPSPANMWASTATGKACSNPMISVLFTEPVNPKTVKVADGSGSTVIVEECSGPAEDVCSKTAPQLVTLTNLEVSDLVDGKYGGIFATPTNLKPDTTYRVTLRDQIVGAKTGLPIGGPTNPSAKNTCKPSGDGVYCYTFTTPTKMDPCPIDSVAVNPSKYLAENLGTILQKDNNVKNWIPVPFPADHCQILDPYGYEWAWKPATKTDQSFDFAQSTLPAAVKTQYSAKQPTETGKPISVSVVEVASTKLGTGTLDINPGAPQVYEACEAAGVHSPTPSTKWTGGDNVCVTAIVAVEFNQPVVKKQASGTDLDALDFNVFKCVGKEAGKECQKVDPQQLPIVKSPMEKLSEVRYRYWLKKTGGFDTSTSYLVEISTSTKGIGTFGKSMPQNKLCRPGVAYCYEFRTSSSAEKCEVKTVAIEPGNWVATDYDVQTTTDINGNVVDKNWLASPMADACILLDAGEFSWVWKLDLAHNGFAAIDPNNFYLDSGPNQAVAAYKETLVDDPVLISAVTKGVKGEGKIAISFPTPSVMDYGPTSCAGGAACLNSDIWIKFSVGMRARSFTDHTKLIKCKDGDQDCAADADAFKNGIPLVSYNCLADGVCLFGFADGSGLEPSTTYRALVEIGPESTAYKRFNGFNYPIKDSKYFSWVFTTGTKDCPIDHIKVIPLDPVAKAQGEKTDFAANPFGPADACHPKGQKLNANEYSWGWSSSDPLVAVPVNIFSSSTQKFSMVGNGKVVDNAQISTITAAAATKSGESIWKLQCNAPPVTCPVGTWPGKDFCCHQPPQVTEHYPAAGEQNICLNTLITADINAALATNSVNSSTVLLGVEINENEKCPGLLDTSGICFGKIPYSLKVVNEKMPNGSEKSRIILTIEKMLPPKTSVKVVIKRDPSKDAETPAIISDTGVPIYGTTWQFGSGSAPCELTNVNVFPSEATLTKKGQTQDLVAYGMSKQAGSFVPLSPIANEYEWNWQWFSGNGNIAQVPGGATDSNTTVTAAGLNGVVDVTELAKITKDIYFKPTTEGKLVAGAAQITAALCEVPWFGADQGGVKSILNKYNLSFWYCRSDAKPGLPNLVATEDTNLSDVKNFPLTTQKAWHLSDPNGGAIGFRIETNLQHYSAREWFLNKEFKGEMTPITIDGFAGVRSGNTIYVAFGNPAGDQQYTNILVMSLSEPISAPLKNIFDQLTNNLTFTTNLSDIGLCYRKNSSGQLQPTSRMCVVDAQCFVAGEPDGMATCAIDKSKFKRDLIRVTDVAAMARAIQKVKAVSGSYPVIAQGTFMAGTATSKWPGWKEFMGEIGMDPVFDPLNIYVSCGQVCTKNITKQCKTNSDCAPDEGSCAGGMPNYDGQTCWNAKDKKYQCWPGSAVYNYRTKSNGQDFNIGLSLEQDISKHYSWVGQWQTNDLFGGDNIDADFCAGYEYGTQTVCGDGQIGGNELCDPPGLKLTRNDISCPYGKATATCSSACTIANSQCLNFCGDGILQSLPEVCDDGAKYNGKYNHCSADCKSLASSDGACGDGIVQKNEACDTASPLGRYYMYVPGQQGNLFVVRCEAGKDATQMSEFVLTGTPGIYTSLDKNAGYLNSGPLVDKVNKFCAAADPNIKYGNCSTDSNLACVNNSQCPFDGYCQVPPAGSKYAATQNNSCNWDCKVHGSYCGDNMVNKEGGEECDGDEVDYDNSCTKRCAPQGCGWLRNLDGSIKCDPLPVPGKISAAGCGDGIADNQAGEECDNGYACQTLKARVVAGEITQEQADKIPCVDNGTNGVACAAPYGQNNVCQYCSATCKKSFATGGYCGDKVKNGPELCDGEQMSITCDPKKFEYHNYTCTAQCIFTDKNNTCLSCGAQTREFTATNNFTDGMVLPITFVDPTLGWLPGPTVVDMKYCHAQGGACDPIGTEGSSYSGSSPWMPVVATKPQIIKGVKTPVHQLDAVLFDAKDACYGDDHYFKFKDYHNTPIASFVSSQIEAGQNLLNKLIPTIYDASGFRLWQNSFVYDDGSDWSYNIKNKNALQKIKIPPGSAYRLVVEVPNKNPQGSNAGIEALLEIKPQTWNNGALPGFFSGGIVLSSFGGVLLDQGSNGVPLETCDITGWNQTLPYRLDTVDAKGIKRDSIQRLSGCLIENANAAGNGVTGPRAELDSAEAYDETGGVIDGSKRYVFTINRASDHGLYAADYELKIRSATEVPLADSGIVVHVFARTSTGWLYVNSFGPKEGGVIKNQNIGAGVQMSTWYPLVIRPGVQTFNTTINGQSVPQVWGANYYPDQALFFGTGNLDNNGYQMDATNKIPIYGKTNTALHKLPASSSIFTFAPWEFIGKGLVAN